MSIPNGRRVLQKRGTFRQSCSGKVSALVMSAFSLVSMSLPSLNKVITYLLTYLLTTLSCQILVMFEAHWPMKTFPSSTCDLTLNSLLLLG